MKTTAKIIGRIAYIVFVTLSLLITSCKKDKEQPANTDVATDYSIAAHWLSIPATVYPVDIFYLYPTAIWSDDNSVSRISTIDDSLMHQGASGSFSQQATAFETVANIYAPFYRQDNMSPADRLNVIAGIPTTDATAAFDYYLKHFNNGRPFILVGHSQGANIVSNLLAGYLKANPDVYARMIAAYVIGAPVTKEYLKENPHLKFAQGPDDTGVIISYNTEAPGLTVVNPVLYGLTGLVINPISWTRDETQATIAESLGSFMPNPQTFVFMQVAHCADARVDTTKGVLICNTLYEDYLAQFDSIAGLPVGIFHVFDISLYYYNIRQNAANRINKFLNK